MSRCIKALAMAIIRCDICGAMLLSVQRLERHLQSVHFVPVYICTICHEVKSSQRAMDQHKIERHPPTTTRKQSKR